MKNLKQIITVIAMAVLMLGSYNVNAQKQDNNEQRQVSEVYQVEIPDSFKAKKVDKNTKIIYIKEYNKKLGGYIYVSGYVDAKGNPKLLSAMTTVKLPSKKSYAGGGYRECAMECTNKPTEFGVILCTFYCMIDQL